MVEMGRRFDSGGNSTTTRSSGRVLYPAGCTLRASERYLPAIARSAFRSRQNMARGIMSGWASTSCSAPLRTTTSRVWIAATTRVAISGVVWR
jgi:hypothetical protein